MEYAVAGLLASLYATCVLLFMLGGAVSVGAAVLTPSGFFKNNPLWSESVIFSLGSGILLLSLGVLAVGLAGHLNKVTLVALCVLFYAPALAMPPIRKLLWPRVKLLQLSRTESVMVLLISVVGFLSWAQATLPPIAADALSYHLTHPKMFLVAEKIYAIPYSRESLWPYLTEMLFTASLPLGGTILATLWHWSFFMLTGWLLYIIGHNLYDRRKGLLACVFFLMTPGAFAQSGQPYVDLALAFYLTLACFAFFLYDRRLEKKYIFLCGLAMAGALSVKYLALGALSIMTLILFLRSRLKGSHLILFLAAVLAGGGVWYLRSYLETGNPVYPFFPEWFHGIGVTRDPDFGLEGTGKSFWDLLALPWNMTFYPNKFGGDIVGPFVLMAAPALIVTVLKLRGRWRYMTLFGAIYAYFLFTQSQNTRFFLSILPLAYIGAAIFFRKISKRPLWMRRWVYSLMCTIFVCHLGIYLYRTRDVWALNLGRLTVESYRQKFDRSYEGYRYLEGVLGEGDHVFNAAEAKAFYSRKPDRFVYHNALLEQSLPDGLLPYLRDKRYRYLWLEKDFNDDLVLFADQNGYRLVHSYAFTEAPKTYRYLIYRYDK